MTTGYNNSALIEIACYKRSGDGLYWPRYPNGDKPFPTIVAAAEADSAASGTLRVSKPLAGAPTAIASASGSLSGGSAQLFTWHPGYLGNSDTVSTHGATLATVQGELDLVGNTNGVVGYVWWPTWGLLESAQDVYDFTTADAVYNRLTTAYATPKRMWMIPEVGYFTRTNPGTNDASILPLYLQQNVALYSQAGYRVAGTVTTVSGASGWYGGDGNGNTCAAQLHRPNVMARYIKLIQAIMNWGKNKPFFEGIVIGENSFWIGANSTNGGGAGYSDSAATTQQDLLNVAGNVAGKTANPAKLFVFENTFMQTVTPCQAYTTSLVQKHALPGQTDSRGLTFIHANSNILPTWGVSAYAGQQLSGSTATVTNWRDQGVRIFCEVQAPDLGAFGGVSGGQVPMTFTSTPAVGATSAVISSNGGYWPNGIGYSVRFSDNSLRTCNVADSKTFTWTGGVGTLKDNTAKCNQGGTNGWTPQDIADAMNKPEGFRAAFCAVSIIKSTDTFVPVDRRWPLSINVFLASPIVNTTYSSNLA